MFEIFLNKPDKKDNYWLDRISVYLPHEKAIIKEFIKYIQKQDEEGFFTIYEYKEAFEIWSVQRGPGSCEALKNI